jgi:hypothetical protein
MNWAATFWGRVAAIHHNPGPVGKDDFPMATVTKIAPERQVPVATIDWLNRCIERGKSEIFTDRVYISPGVANAILERNPDNRNLSATKAEHYARDMAEGRWPENGETIIIARDGLLNDGQHRMQAVIDANLAIPFLFVFGVARESRTTVDQGKARGAGDYLSMDGIQYAKNAATAAKFIIAYERAEGRNIAQRSKITNAEIVARVKGDADMIASAAYAHKRLNEYRSLFSHTVMATCHYILSDIHKVEAEAFLEQVAVGENIKRGDPAFAVRQAFMGDKRERQDAMEIIFHGWNAYRQNRPLKLAKCYGTLPALV